MARQVYVRVPSALVLRAIKALREVAQNDAGQSQAPDLYGAEDTQEWQDAKDLSALREQALAEAKRGG